MKKIRNLFFIFFLSAIIFSCTDVIDISVKEGVSQLSVDALINNKSETQTIKLTLTQGYFDNSTIKPALGASVFVFDQDSVAYEFKDLKKDGNYIYDATIKPLNKIGKQYALYINYGGDEFIRGATWMTESMSYSICEHTGEKGKLRKQKKDEVTGEIIPAWIKTFSDQEAERQGYIL
jgi:hypothetical protein